MRGRRLAEHALGAPHGAVVVLVVGGLAGRHRVLLAGLLTGLLAAACDTATVSSVASAQLAKPDRPHVIAVEGLYFPLLEWMHTSAQVRDLTSSFVQAGEHNRWTSGLDGGERQKQVFQARRRIER